MTPMDKTSATCHFPKPDGDAKSTAAGDGSCLLATFFAPPARSP